MKWHPEQQRENIENINSLNILTAYVNTKLRKRQRATVSTIIISSDGLKYLPRYETYALLEKNMLKLHQPFDLFDNYIYQHDK